MTLDPAGVFCVALTLIVVICAIALAKIYNDLRTHIDDLEERVTTLEHEPYAYLDGTPDDAAAWANVDWDAMGEG